MFQLYAIWLGLHDFGQEKRRSFLQIVMQVCFSAEVSVYSRHELGLNSGRSAVNVDDFGAHVLYFEILSFRSR